MNRFNHIPEKYRHLIGQIFRLKKQILILPNGKTINDRPLSASNVVYSQGKYFAVIHTQQKRRDRSKRIRDFEIEYTSNFLPVDKRFDHEWHGTFLCDCSQTWFVECDYLLELMESKSDNEPKLLPVLEEFWKMELKTLSKKEICAYTIHKPTFENMRQGTFFNIDFNYCTEEKIVERFIGDVIDKILGKDQKIPHFPGLEPITEQLEKQLQLAKKGALDQHQMQKFKTLFLEFAKHPGVSQALNLSNPQQLHWLNTQYNYSKKIAKTTILKDYSDQLKHLLKTSKIKGR